MMFVIEGAATRNGVEQVGTTKKSKGTSEKADGNTVKLRSSRGNFQRNRWWEEDFDGGKWGGGLGDDRLRGEISPRASYHIYPFILPARQRV
jgi:hypothetical protein